MESKICSKCKISKRLEFFHKRSEGYLRSRCIECTKEDRKKYNTDNQEIIKVRNKRDYENRKEYCKEYSIKYRELNKEYEKERNKIWCSNNREKINKRNLEYREKNLKNPLFKIKENIRNLIRTSIKSNGYNKSSKTSEILGCTIENFKNYIESQFQEGMTWNNYPEWHLDHKIPISWADSEGKIIELNHYTNFQPLWAFDNLSKGNKWMD
jgi:hypothetical protein